MNPHDYNGEFCACGRPVNAPPPAMKPDHTCALTRELALRIGAMPTWKVAAA